MDLQDAYRELLCLEQVDRLRNPIRENTSDGPIAVDSIYPTSDPERRDAPTKCATNSTINSPNATIRERYNVWPRTSPNAELADLELPTTVIRTKSSRTHQAKYSSSQSHDNIVPSSSYNGNSSFTQDCEQESMEIEKEM